MNKFKYGPIEKTLPVIQMKISELVGYWTCLIKFGEWRNGVQWINSDITIQDAIENEILRWFEPQYLNEVLKSIRGF
jgi:hypothetical protein